MNATDARTGLTAAPAPLLSMMRELPDNLSADDRRLVAQQLLILLRDYYVHLPLKRSALGVDPVAEATLLIDDAALLSSDAQLYRRLFAILSRLRDRHTGIDLPDPWKQMVAYLPFAAEAFYAGGRRVMVASKVMPGALPDTFVEGVEINYWNGVPIARFVESLSFTSDGAHPFARIASVLRSLTVRALGYVLPPEEDWVTIGYRGVDGADRSVTVPWRVYLPSADTGAGSATRALSVSGSVRTGSLVGATTHGVDPSTLVVNGAWYDLFAAGAASAQAYIPTTTRTLTVDGTDYGYLRIFHFDVADPAGFVTAVADQLRTLPETGLVIDIRSNPGGTIPAGEGLLQLFTDRPVLSEPVSFRVTERTRYLGEVTDFARWRRSFEWQLQTGDTYTQGHSLSLGVTPARPYRYPGPVVVVIDALCYSTSDFFAAGMQDNALATLIGVDPVTGAGGANMWTQATLASIVSSVGASPDAGLLGEHAGVGFNVALRRSSRVGMHDGLPVEGLGVFADQTYLMTQRDVLESNADLLDHCCRVLAAT